MRSTGQLGNGAASRKKPVKAAILLLAFTILGTNIHEARGFDGKRRGFVMGEGLGIGPVIEFSGSAGHETNIGLGLNFLIGYGWNERNILAIDGNFGYRHSDLYTRKSRSEGWTDFDGIPLGDQSINQGFTGISWYHYYGNSGKSLFTAIGFGRYVFIPGSFGANKSSFGWMIAGGYEFCRHLQAGIYWSSGKTSDYFNEFEHRQISILITAIHY